MALELKSGHNQTAYLEKDDKWSQYNKIIDAVVQSNYHTTFTISPPIHVETLREFWANAETTIVNNEFIALKSTIKGKTMAVTPEILSHRLGIDDNNAPKHIATGVVQATLTACDYKGDLSHAILIPNTNYCFII